MFPFSCPILPVLSFRLSIQALWLVDKTRTLCCNQYEFSHERFSWLNGLMLKTLSEHNTYFLGTNKTSGTYFKETVSVRRFQVYNNFNIKKMFS